MRGVLFDEFSGPLRLVELPDPDCPDDAVVVTVVATGLCRSDWHGWRGHDPDIVLPHVPGHEWAGTVARVGAGVTGWQVGDRVTAPFVCACGRCASCRRGDLQVCERQTQPGFTHHGSFAEQVVVRNAVVNLVALPDAMDFATAAALGCRFATAYRAVVAVGAVQAGERVAVLGCGGVGLAAVMIARAQAAEVFAVDPAPAARRRAIELGAQASERLDVRDLDVTIDAIGDVAALNDGVHALRPRGRHVQVGLLGDAASVPAAIVARVLAKELQLLGSHGMSARDYPAMLARIASGELDPSALLGERIPLAQAPQALAALPDRPGHGIVVIEPQR